MTPFARRIIAASSLATALLVTGCTSGLAAHAGSDFTACLQEAGVDLSQLGTWTREQEQDALADAGAMGCVLSDLPADERRGVLGWAFPDVPENAAAEAQAPVADAVGAFLEGRTAQDAEAIADAGELLVALGMRGAEPSEVRDALALRLHLDSAGPLYEAWRTDAALDDTHGTRIRFVAEQRQAGGALAEFFTRTEEALRDAQVAASGEEG